MGNPVRGELAIEVVDVQGVSLELQVVNEQRCLVNNCRVTPTAAIHRERFDMSTQAAGILVLRVTGSTRVQVLKVLKW